MRTLSRLVAAALVAAATGLALPAAPASAAACSSAAGVTVVVDFNELGGGVQQVCDGSGGGDTAASLFDSNGFPLTYAQLQRGFVCRVSGVPEDDPCMNTPPSDAYWSLYWSDGKTGTWSYSSAGAGSLRIPDGGYVAFSWKQGSAAAPPSATPTPHAAPPPPTQPTQEPSGDGGNGGNDGSGGNGANGGADNDGGSQDDDPPGDDRSGSTSPSASGSPSASESAKPSKGTAKNRNGKKGDASTSPSASSSTDPTGTPSDELEEDAAPTASPPDADDDGLPGWVAPGLIVILFAAAGVTVLVRRRGAAGP